VRTSLANSVLHLFQNSLDNPDPSTPLATYTANEADFDGYDRVTLDRPDWTTPVVASCCATSTWGTTAIQWNVLGGPAQTIYGYAFVDPTSNILRFIQRFDPEDIAPLEVGGKVLLLPKFTLTSAECEEDAP